MLAFSRGILVNDSSLISSITERIKSESVGTVLLGVPKTLSGGESAMTKEVLAFQAKLRATLPENIELETRDERLTSIIAETNIRARELPKKKREQKSLRDEEAARILLQEYLDTSK
jgi:putative transcription antitermination factor YqgF